MALLLSRTANAKYANQSTPAPEMGLVGNEPWLTGVSNQPAINRELKRPE